MRGERGYKENGNFTSIAGSISGSALRPSPEQSTNMLIPCTEHWHSMGQGMVEAVVGIKDIKVSSVKTTPTALS